VLDAITTAPGSASRADEVADYNEAGGDSDPHLQGRPGMCCELRNSLDETEPGADCALRIVFMCLGIAEIGEHPVANVLGDKAAVAFD
jgi:hypothetical protein